MEHKKLSCATYNILHGRYSDLVLNNIRFLVAHGAEVICLQEAEDDFEKLLNELLREKLFGNWKVEYVHSGNGGDVATMWDSNALSLKRSKPVGLKKLARPNLIEAIHGVSKETERSALVTDFDWHGRTLQIINAHLSWEGGTKHRVEQLELLRGEFEQSRADFRVIMGDFNTLALRPWKRPDEEAIEEVLGEGFINTLPRLPWTYDTSFRDPADGLRLIVAMSRALGIKWRQRLDYIFVKDMQVSYAEMHDLPGSDHRPLSATFIA